MADWIKRLFEKVEPAGYQKSVYEFNATIHTYAAYINCNKYTTQRYETQC